MDSTVMDDHRSLSDDESGYQSRGGVLVSSTVSEDLIGLNIQNEVDAVSVEEISSSTSIDEDVLSVCANDEDTKFVDDILIGERNTETPVRSGKRRREKTEFIEPSPVPKSKRNKTINRRKSHQSQREVKNTSRMSGNVRSSKSMPLLNEMVVQTSEISSSTKSDVGEMKKPIDPCKMSDLFESKENKEIAKIFDNPCVKFLKGDCKHDNCIQEHNLPESNILRKRLNELPVDEVRIAFNSHVRSFDRLLERYFCTFTEYFGEHGHKADLLGMMTICKNPVGHMQSNCVHVLDGLVQLGMSYSHALVHILNCHNEMSEKSMFVLTALITDKRNDNVNRFLNDLKTFYENKFRFNPIIIDRLMQICLDMPYDEKWYTFLRKVVNEWTNIDDLNLDLVYDFCTMTPRRCAIIRKYLANPH